LEGQAVTDDLLARLRACLDTDERVALAAAPEWDAEDWWIGTPDGNSACGRFIQSHDPARVLRWVKAAREILGWYDEVTEGLDLSGYDDFGSLKDLPADKSLAVTLAVEAVRALASVCEVPS
jgi:hypothetical protein